MAREASSKKRIQKRRDAGGGNIPLASAEPSERGGEQKQTEQRRETQTLYVQLPSMLRGLRRAGHRLFHHILDLGDVDAGHVRIFAKADEETPDILVARRLQLAVP